MRELAAAPTPHGSGDWLVHLRLQKTASSSIGRLLATDAKAECSWLKWCRCHSMPLLPRPPPDYEHGGRCEEMLSKGLKRCGDEGRHSLAADPPHADFVDLVEGLYGAGIAPERARMFTMLRDPVERAVSEYLHVRFVLGRERRCATTGSLGEIWAWDYRASCNFTLAQFATDPAYAPAMNRQTRMLAGTAGREPDELYANGQEMLATARDNLRRMSWFGITDSVNLSMSVLPTSMHSRVSAARRGRVKIKPATARHRAQMVAEPGYQEALEALRARNHLDEELVQYARGLLQDVVAGRERFADSLARAAPGASPVATLDTDEAVAADVAIGDSLPPDFCASHPECGDIENVGSMHAGTLSWYARQHACAWSETLYRRAIFAHHESGVRFSMRTSLPPTRLVRGGYVVAFGAAQTLGTMSSTPYTDRLRAITSMPTIPVGLGGTGPGLFSELLRAPSSAYARLLRALVRDAAFVIVQAMSGRSVGVAGCEAICWNMYCRNKKGLVSMSENAAKRAGPNATEDVKARWIRGHIELLERVRSVGGKRIVFLYMSSEPWARKRRSTFPQLVKDSWARAVCAEASLCVTSIADESTQMPRPLAGTSCAGACENRGRKLCEQEQARSSCHCGFLQTSYYPSDAHQSRTARLLATALGGALRDGRRLLEEAPLADAHSSAVASPVAAASLPAGARPPGFVRRILERNRTIYPPPPRFLPMKAKHICPMPEATRRAILGEPLAVAPPLRPRFHVVVTKQLRRRAWLLMTIRSVVRLYPTAEVWLHAKNDSQADTLVVGGLLMQVVEALGAIRQSVQIRTLTVATTLREAAKCGVNPPMEPTVSRNVEHFILRLKKYETAHRKKWGESGWYSHLSDFVRYAVLVLHGGVFLDLDAPLLKRLPGDAQPHGTGAARYAIVGAEADANEDHYGKVQLNGAVLGATSRHPWVYELYSRAINTYVSAKTLDNGKEESITNKKNFAAVGPNLLTNVTLSAAWQGVVNVQPSKAFQPLHYWWGYRKAGLAKFIYGARESEMAKCFGGRSDQCKRLTDRLSGGIAFHMNERLLARNRKYYPPAAGSVCGWLFDELGVMDIAKTDEDAHQAFMCKLCVDAFHQQNRRAFEGNMCATQGSCFNDIVSALRAGSKEPAAQPSPLALVVHPPPSPLPLAMPSPLNSSTM